MKDKKYKKQSNMEKYFDQDEEDEEAIWSNVSLDE